VTEINVPLDLLFPPFLPVAKLFSRVNNLLDLASNVIESEQATNNPEEHPPTVLLKNCGFNKGLA